MIKIFERHGRGGENSLHLDVPLEVDGSMVNGSMGYFTYL